MLTLEELMNVTLVAATGTQKTVSEAPSIATVITSKQIENSSATTLSEVLEMAPGLFVYPASHLHSNYDFRGIHTNYSSQVILMINGTRIERNQNGSRQPRFSYPVSNIERIEIIRGSGSAIYGADAFAGVINIITKDADALAKTSRVGVRYGSFESKEAFLNYGTNIKDIAIGLNLSYMKNDNDSDRIYKKDLQTYFDSLFGTSASKAPAPLDTYGEWTTLALNAHYSDFEMNLYAQKSGKNGTGGGVALALDPVGHYEYEQINFDLYYRSNPADGIDWEQKLSLGHIDAKSYLHVFPAGAFLPIGDDGNAFSAGADMVLFTDGYIGTPSSKDYRNSVESTLIVSRFKNHLFRISVGATSNKTKFFASSNFGPSVIDGSVSPVGDTLTSTTNTPYIFIPESSREIYHISLQDEIRLNDDWSFTAGVRDDYYSDFGNMVNPRLALVWQGKGSLSAKILFGRAFHAPTFQDLYAQNNPVGVGNSDLKPETIDMTEVGLIYRPNSKWKVDSNIYHYHADELISQVPATVGTQFANGG